MLKRGAFVALLSAMVLCATSGQLAAEEPASQDRPAKGTKAITVRLTKGQKLPEGARPGTAVDLVSEMSEPIKTGIALLNIKLLAIDGKLVGVEQPTTVVVQLTPVQLEILQLMQKHATKLELRLHAGAK